MVRMSRRQAKCKAEQDEKIDEQEGDDSCRDNEDDVFVVGDVLLELRETTLHAISIYGFTRSLATEVQVCSCQTCATAIRNQIAVLVRVNTCHVHPVLKVVDSTAGELALYIIPSGVDVDDLLVLGVWIVFAHRVEERVLQDVQVLVGGDGCADNSSQEDDQEQSEVEEDQEPIFFPSSTTSEEGEKDDERAEDDEDDGGRGVEVDRDDLTHHRGSLLD